LDETVCPTLSFSLVLRNSVQVKDMNRCTKNPIVEKLFIAAVLFTQNSHIDSSDKIAVFLHAI
jgi:hypothetical protein